MPVTTFFHYKKRSSKDERFGDYSLSFLSL